MQTNTVVNTFALFSLLNASLASPISPEAIIGAFAGSMVYMLSENELSPWKRNAFGFVSFSLGITSHSIISNNISWIGVTISAAVVSSVSVCVLIALFSFAHSSQFKQLIANILSRFLKRENSGKGDSDE